MSPNETYKRDLLRKYLEGSISDVERHELEKIALDDPFVFDAMEGATLHQAAHKSNINELQHKLYPRLAKVVRPAFWKRLSVAAGVLVLVAALFFVNRQFDSQEDMAVMQNAEKAKATLKDLNSAKNESEPEIPQAAHVEKTTVPIIDDLVEETNENITAAPASNQVSQVSTSENWHAKKSSGISNQETIKEEPLIAAAPPVAADVPLVNPATPSDNELKNEINYDDTQEAPAVEADIVAEQADKVVVAKTKRSTASSSERKEQAYAKDYATEAETTTESEESSVASAFEKKQKATIVDRYDILINLSYGTVIDENGEALIGANIYVMGSSIGVTTDFDGKFELPDSITYPVVVEASYTGYNKASMLLQEPTPNIAFIMDTEGLLLDEVVVASRKERRKQSNETDALISDQDSGYYDVSKVYFVEGSSFPEIGGTLFDKYFAKELERRNACVQQGTYQFKFVVKRNGKLSDVNLATPVNVNCEEILIDIFEKGGNWIPKEKKGKTYTQYTLKIP